MLPRNLFQKFLNVHVKCRGMSCSSYLLNNEVPTEEKDEIDEFESLLIESIEETKGEEVRNFLLISIFFRN